MKKVQLDTNILTRLATPGHDHHVIAARATAALSSEGCSLCICPQNLFEFWVVATRPVQNQGLGFSVAEVVVRLAKIKSTFLLESDDAGLLVQWEQLVERYECKGKIAHDARIVAGMIGRGVDQLLTFNLSDFRRFSEIELIDPTAIAAVQ